MLDVLSYPVSLLLWLWHGAFGFLLGGTNVVGWVLAIAFLVFTLRALLLRPAVRQARYAATMRALAPRLGDLRARYGSDRERYAAELQELLGEHRVSPLAGILPLLLQLPVFLGLHHVLRALTSVPVGETYALSARAVGSFLQATVGGVHLGDAMIVLSTWQVSWSAAVVVVPLLVVAAAATYLTTRVSAVAAPGGALGRVLRYLPPVTILVVGTALPVGLLVYWVSNNLWTLGQQYVIARRGKPADAGDRR